MLCAELSGVSFFTRSKVSIVKMIIVKLLFVSSPSKIEGDKGGV